MEEQTSTQTGRKTIDEIKAITDPVEYALAAADYFSIRPVTIPQSFLPETGLLSKQSVEFWQKAKAVPLCRTAGRITVAFADPFDLPSREEVGRICGGDIWNVIAPAKDITDALNRVKAKEDSLNPALAMENIMKGQDSDIEVSSVDTDKANEMIDATLDAAGEAPVIRMVNSIMIEALKTKASDIHFEALEKSSRLRYRIDGALVERPSPPKALHGAVVSRIKIMSNLDIAERRKPQDGRFKIRALKKEVDVRVSILPTVHGEKVVMRILDKSNLAPGLSSLGLDEYAYKAMKYAIDQPHGIILVTGPTGSGKTTTLYSCLQDLNQPDVNIVTAEDPVEYELAGVNQCHVNVAQGLTFAGILRSVLRQDPDVVLVGEIRDGETADIAVKAALTGHLVLSTLHTNDACGVVARLFDMGIQPFMLASSLILAQAQRLFRRLCPFCRQPVKLDLQMLEVNKVDPAPFEGVEIFGPVGCPKCHGTGYKGRGAMMEVLPISTKIRNIIEKGGNAELLRKTALEEGMVTLKDAGMMKVRAGLTSLEAAFAVSGGE
ncbi:MAG: GspE/PulE family protein [Kiritimatiellae bacterium]|jgi:type II secretory ATPase GspE/PulE/Tfp pilus assembly ATPase PilB-like protein|nr:GspE/PulE family protein [Kiritimatiellia bacterium]